MHPTFAEHGSGKRGHAILLSSPVHRLLPPRLCSLALHVPQTDAHVRIVLLLLNRIFVKYS